MINDMEDQLDLATKIEIISKYKEPYIIMHPNDISKLKDRSLSKRISKNYYKSIPIKEDGLIQEGIFLVLDGYKLFT